MMWRHASRGAGWNVVLLVCGLALLLLAAEGWLRLTRPFKDTTRTSTYVPGVGTLFAPHSESKSTDHAEFWQLSRANSLGFLDREPPSPELGYAGCHVAFVGDSFTEAREVPVADKVHVRLEGMADVRLRRLDVVTTAWGVRGMGQVQQLAMWDKWIRHWAPDIVALVFVYNDYRDNLRESWTLGAGKAELNIEIGDPLFPTAHRVAGDRIVVRLPGTVLVPHEREVSWGRQLLPSSLRPWLLPWWRYQRARYMGRGGEKGGGSNPFVESRSRLHGVRVRPMARADATRRLAARRLVDARHAPFLAASAG